MKKFSLILINIVKNRFFGDFHLFLFFYERVNRLDAYFSRLGLLRCQRRFKFCTCVIFCCGFLSPTQKVGMAQLCRTPC